MAQGSSGAGAPTHYKVGDLKSKFLHLAQTSVYHIKFGLPVPEEGKTGLAEFLASEGRNITTRDISDIELLCSEASLPGSTLATHEVTGDYPGVTEKMVYRRIYDDTLDLTFYVDAKYNVIEFFDGWMNYATGQGAVKTTGKTNQSFKRNNQSYRMIYPNQYKGSIYLTKYEKDVSTFPIETMIYTFVDAFPISIVSSPISYNASELLKFTVSFSYIRYVREKQEIAIPQDTMTPNYQAAFNNLQFNPNAFKTDFGLNYGNFTTTGGVNYSSAFSSGNTINTKAAFSSNSIL